MSNNNNTPLIEEYKIAQKRINHFERLIWQIGSILNGSISIMLGFLIKAETKQLKYWLIVTLVSTVYSWLWFLFEYRYRDINLILFERMKEIEKELNLKLHTKITEHDKKSKQCILNIRAHFLIKITAIVIPLILWLFLLYLICEAINH